MTEMLDARLKERLHAVLNRQPVTEAELRRLTEEGNAIAMLMGARLERSERTLVELESDPASSLTEIAATLREVNVLRPSLDELHTMLTELNRRAREFRKSWVSAR